MRRMMLSNQGREVTAVGMQTCFNATLHVVEVTSPISRRMLSSSAARVRGLFPYTVPFNMPHRKKSGGERYSVREQATDSRGTGRQHSPRNWACDFYNMQRRIKACLHADGGHFQHLI